MQSLEPRSRHILFAIVSEYITTGEPVGSRTIAKNKDIGLSAASIRNIMSDLTEAGYITQPHVSAGRIPTDVGYRSYVDALLKTSLLAPAHNHPDIEALIRAAGTDVRDLLRQSSSILAELSRKTGIVSSTRPEEQRFRTIEFIKVADDRILVVLVSTTGFVQNKVIFDEDGVDQETLERYSRMLNDMLKDLDLRQAKKRIERELAHERARMDAVLSKALKLGHVILSLRADEREIFIDGQTNILDEPEFSDVTQLKALWDTLAEKSKLLKILDKTFEERDLQILIGSEHGLNEIESCSIVAYPIRAGKTGLASISVIGPKRMNYQKVVPLVITTGQALTRLMKRIVESPT